MPSALRTLVMRSLPLVAIALLAGCSIAKPRTDDPYEKMNRKVYAFNDSLDKAVIRPVAVGYRKVTNPTIRRSMSDFFTNIHMPITVANDLLQARPMEALQGSGRFIVNLTLGIGGFFDPASQLGIPLKETDFGITLRAGVFRMARTWWSRCSAPRRAATSGACQWMATSSTRSAISRGTTTTNTASSTCLS